MSALMAAGVRRLSRGSRPPVNDVDWNLDANALLEHPLPFLRVETKLRLLKLNEVAVFETARACFTFMADAAGRVVLTRA